MTIRVPADNILDKILSLFGKEREIVIPEGAGKIYREYGPSVQIMAKKENFFKALFRKNKKQEKEE
jgi:hypothetical protein